MNLTLGNLAAHARNMKIQMNRKSAAKALNFICFGLAPQPSSLLKQKKKLQQSHGARNGIKLIKWKRHFSVSVFPTEKLFPRRAPSCSVSLMENFLSLPSSFSRLNDLEVKEISIAGPDSSLHLSRDANAKAPPSSCRARQQQQNKLIKLFKAALKVVA